LVPVGTSVPRPNIRAKGNNNTIKRQQDGASTTANHTNIAVTQDMHNPSSKQYTTTKEKPD
jgi:uncharacterized protein YbbK (DUF523 family)